MNEQTRSGIAAPAAVHYTIQARQPQAHLFEVTCEVARPDPAGQVFSLPAWIPGSYMIREFARNIVRIRAEANGQVVALEKLDKHSWRAAPLANGASLKLVYEVYAWDLSVRAAHLDQTHGFFNGTSVFLAPAGFTGIPCTVDILPPCKVADGWRVATALPRVAGACDAAGFGRYHAADYDELVDHPVEMGTWQSATFTVHGVPHEVVLSGRQDCDLERLCADLQRICAWQIELFGLPAPMQRYVFLTMVVGDGYGGLEHRASTALLVSRKDLPYVGMKDMPEGYVSLLGLFSHEYFHSWNVKRIKPAAFTPYRLEVENYTRLLWLFEGFTSYYDDLCLLRSGVIDTAQYLRLVAKNISTVLRGSGRLKQSVAESSFDAWTKYYRQDENAPNAIVSYYTKGSLIALALDLKLRSLGSGTVSLDDLMRRLWQAHGLSGRGIGEEEIFEHIAAVAEHAQAGAGSETANWLRALVEGTEDVPLATLLPQFGIAYTAKVEGSVPWLGLKHATRGVDVAVTQVLDGGPAQAAGVSAGDVLVALDGLRVAPGSLDAQLGRYPVGAQVMLHVFRRDELMQFSLTLAAAPQNKVELSECEDGLSPATQQRRSAWLSGQSSS